MAVVDRRLLRMLGRGCLLSVKALGFTATVLLVAVSTVSAIIGLIAVFSAAW